MTARVERAVTHFAARRLAPRLLGRVGLLRLVPSGFLAMLLAEGALLAWTQLRKRPELRRKLWQALTAKPLHGRP